ncbi:SsgA family sporulation/cell division regulator [Streptomyces sp. RLB3-17]|uniref:SsgA family sporulation/cell division regulator n=1 Tax=unclassified Streptomyces TaxID=2593676 RepID=UPI0011624C84|nr:MULTISPECIES: SsgA family sporulation/cell division regulator [unclassified Streptomyces]NMI54286.1 SsgA family sporulation/cell division regulator [Streptomyces sp. RLA2-12]QDN63122.1 SsgA family sporulation/cell division regulator [Streptomyces sp. S1D4-20]QDN73174.1 SsgA family sporulation/cell division regulator [Streptomyces sp. S1D4-14]QDO03884.1 SsgA family sporulation/cell division regulator [Streptomyces sp. RLB1-9]QDO25615.1 SsgA family sporulation/cell division regulator [Strepto
MAIYSDQMLYMGLVRALDERIVVPTRLVYEAHDPFAVRIVFHPGVDHSVQWIVARDLLVQGLSQPSGQGDVQIWPTGSGLGAELNLSLSSESGVAWLTAPFPVVEQWLERTFRLVPAGHEADNFDVDAELSQLLHGTR